jgi:hypothetical protein
MSKVRLLFIVLPSWDMPHLTSFIKDSLKNHTSHYDVAKSRDDYWALTDRYNYEVIACWGLPGLCKELVED